MKTAAVVLGLVALLVALDSCRPSPTPRRRAREVHRSSATRPITTATLLPPRR